MNGRGWAIAVLAASVLLLMGVFLQGPPATASPPAETEPRYDPVSADTWIMPSEIGVQATVTETKAAMLALELLLSPIYYYVDLPIAVHAAP